MLTPKQIKFCEEYVVDLNGTQAAIRAGYSEKTANEQASQLLAKLSIQEKVKELQNGLSESTLTKAEDVINELKKTAFSDITNFIGQVSGKTFLIKDFSILPKELTACIESIQETKDGIKFKLYDKIKSLELLGRHLGIFQDNININTPKGYVVKLPAGINTD